MHRLRRHLPAFVLWACGLLAFQALAAGGALAMPCCPEACDSPPQCQMLGCMGCALPAIAPAESGGLRPEVRAQAPRTLDSAAGPGPVAKVWTPPD